MNNTSPAPGRIQSAPFIALIQPGTSIALLCLFGFATSSPVSGQVLLRLDGRVMDEAGLPISGAQVQLGSRVTEINPGAGTVSPLIAPPPFRATAVTAGDGGFSFNGVPKGPVHICVNVPGGEYLSNCGAWGQAGATFWADTGKTVIPPIRLERGYRLTVRVNGALGTALQRAQMDPDILIGVTAARRFEPMLPVISSATLREYRLLVPYGRAFRVTAQSKRFKIKDSAGRELPASPRDPIDRMTTIQRGGNPGPVVLTAEAK